ncbi:hypothetical protein NLP66_24720, partial [Escherichia coli]|nr:hypothetical protein [Escherichia coli]
NAFTPLNNKLNLLLLCALAHYYTFTAQKKWRQLRHHFLKYYLKYLALALSIRRYILFKACS